MDLHDLKLEDIWSKDHQRAQCIEWITKNKYKNVCLQFPDTLLAHSEPVCSDLKDTLKDVDEVYIMADTTYGDCCVDEITANHVNGDCIVHFGNACLSENTTLPVFYCFPRLPIDREQFKESLAKTAGTEGAEVVIYLDIGYHHLLTDQNIEPDKVTEIIDADKSFIDCLGKLKASRLYVVPSGSSYYAKLEKNDEKDCKDTDYSFKCYAMPIPLNTGNDSQEVRICIFVGTINDNRRFFNLILTVRTTQENWLIYDPKTSQMTRDTKSSKVFNQYIRRRSYYMEKCKDAQLLGILVATVSMPGYLDIVKRLQLMAMEHGIRTKIIYVGRINPAKLANFMEIDCYILIGCPFNSIFESKDYFKPIVSVFEAEMALNPSWHLRYPDVYVTDFRDLLPAGQHFNDYRIQDKEQEDIDNVSLITGKLRQTQLTSNKDSSDADKLSLEGQKSSSTALLQSDQAVLMTLNKGLPLSERSWQGLDPALGQHDPSKLKKGLSGIPTSYTHDN